MITSSPDQKESWLLENLGGVKVLRLKVPRTKDVSNIRRALSELVMPFIMMIQLKKSPMVNERWDGVVGILHLYFMVHWPKTYYGQWL